MREQYNKKDAQAVKGFAILLLLFYHLFKDILDVKDVRIIHFFFSDTIFASVADACRICVAIFVFVSAYGISKQIMASETIDTLSVYKVALNRGKRLLIDFVCMYFSVNLLWFWIFDYAGLYGHGKQSFIFAILDALGLSDIFGTPSLNETWWYMGLAYTIIFFVPALAIVCKKIGYGLLPFAVLLPFCFTMNLNMQFYLATMIFAVVTAYGGWLDKIKEKKWNILLGVSLSLFLFVALLILRQNAVAKDYIRPLVDALGAFVACVFVGCYLTRIKLINRILGFVGKYSLDIFLVHSFFYLILWRKYIYFSEYAIIEFITLIIASLLYSIILEFIKRLVVKIVCKFREK